MATNKGFDSQEIEKLKNEMAHTGKPFVYIEPEEVSEDLAEFFFIGSYEGKPVIFDCMLGTLQLAYESNLMEMAENKAREKFPDYKGFDFDIDENGSAVALEEESEEVEEYKAFAMFELEEAGEAKVAESVELDPSFEYGIGLEAYLNVPAINEEVIKQFIHDFNHNQLRLDPTLYAFEAEDDED